MMTLMQNSAPIEAVALAERKLAEAILARGKRSKEARQAQEEYEIICRETGVISPLM